MDIKHQYNVIGQRYISGRESFFDKRDDWSQTAVKKYLGNLKNKKILDVGCGGGIDIKIFENNEAIAFGVDPSEVMVEEAKKRSVNPSNVLIGEYESLPFQTNYFDIIFGRFSLHYLNNFDKAYEEINRVLVPGGKVFQIVSHPIFDLTYMLEDDHKGNDLITVEICGNKTKISFPPHSIKDYLSETFFKLFDLEIIDEYREEELKRKNIEIPGALLYCAKARK